MITEQQRLERLNGIGGSDVAIILGLSNYKTPYQLYLEKTGLVTESVTDSPFQEWGGRLEPLIRLKYVEKNEIDILAPKGDEKHSPPCQRIKYELDTIVHPFHDFMRANIDGFVPSKNKVLEIKCANSFMGKEWGESATDVIPPQYLCQVAHYVSCMNAQGADIAVLIGGFDYREYHYNRDLELENTIINACKEFWDCVQLKRPPKPINLEDLRLLYKTPQSNRAVAQSNIKSCVDALAALKDQMKKLKETEEINKFTVMEFMKTSDCLVDSEGRTLATWAADKNGKRSFRLKGE